MYKFGQIEISSKDFNSKYQVQKDVDLEKIRVSEGVVANRCDTRYIVGYEVEPSKNVPLHMKTPKNCFSLGVSRYNESSPWKMGFNVEEYEAWTAEYQAIWGRICDVLNIDSVASLRNGYVNAKLIT